ncbi:Gfo/Idh/MocA family protein [Kitasatospora sp. NPDC089509]|uniref:Gfo/Idh/MocA family protein n=1 Tax=Kitasatospora sp. NPDC089509 TaxID=3364079 RepID=UPI00382F0C1F
MKANNLTGASARTPGPLRIGLVGHGWWAQRYLLPPLLKADGVTVAALCGREAGRAAEAAEQNGIPASFVDVETMVSGVELDAVVIASPPSSHLEAVTAAATRGLHVFCEKPLARNAAETEQMVRACAGVRTMVGFTQRWHPAVSTLHRLVEGGEIGEVRHLRYVTRAALSGDPSAPWSWRYSEAEYSYGALSDLGPHAVDLVRWLGGEIAAVSATARTVVAERPDEAGGYREVRNWDDATVNLELDSGIGASVTVSRVLPPSPYRRFHHELDVLGTKGAITFSSDRPTEVVLTRAGQDPVAVTADGIEAGSVQPGSFEEIMLIHRFGAARQAADMLAWFGGEQQVAPPTMADGHRGQQVLDLAARAVEAGGWLRCP